MSDIEAGAAPAATEAVSAPIVEAPITPPNPIDTAPTPEAAPKVEAKKAPSIDEALDRATAKVESEAKPEKPVDKAEKAEPVKTEAQKRDDTGKFASKEPVKTETAEKPVETVAPKVEAKPATEAAKPAGDAPSRFSPDAKAAWETAPEPVKAEVHRAIRELEEGHQKYKASHEAYEQLKPFAERAKQGGTDLNTALTKYVGMEDALRQNPIGGLTAIMENLGLKTSDGRMLTLRDVAAHIMGQTPEQSASQQDQTIAQINAKIAKLEQSVGSVTKTFEDQKTNEVMTKVQTFASDPQHSRFEELAGDIKFFIETGRTPDLSEAYKLAERLNPAPVVSFTPAPATTPAETAPLNPAGSKSITGAPSSGSNPALKKPSKSLDESLDRAFAKVG